MNKFIKPKIVVSKCLDFDKCRYNGEVIPSKFIRRLCDYVEFIQICPEVEIGLGTPRDPIRLVNQNDKTMLIQPSTKKDLTSAMNRFSENFLNSLFAVDGFILKLGSPSCGTANIKVYHSVENTMSKRKEAGLFAAKVLEKFPGLAVEDEGRLTNFRIREHFLTKVFLFARFREIKLRQSFAQLVQFQTENKLLFMAYSQKHMRLLGRIVANGKRLDKQGIFNDYEVLLQESFKRSARFTSHINVLMHALGYFKNKISAEEKRYFLGLIDKYRDEIIPLSAVLAALQVWIVKYDQGYLKGQTYFEPYPEQLMDITDSGKGRDGKSR